MKINKITFLTALLFSALAISCSDDDDLNEELTCNPTEPFEEFDWLNDLRESLDNCSCRTAIFKGEYEGNTVFYKTITVESLCNWQFETDLYNCDGEITKKYRYSEETPRPYDDYIEEVTDREELYICEGD